MENMFWKISINQELYPITETPKLKLSLIWQPPGNTHHKMLNNETYQVGFSDEPKPILSEETYTACYKMIHFLILLVSFMGIVTNIINLKIFIRQGVTSDSTTTGLFSLAISDLLDCVTMLPVSSCVFVLIFDYLRFSTCTVVVTMTANYPHDMFSKITCWITVYMSIERALCVAMPLKVKQLLRPRITMVAMIVTSLFWVIFYIPYAVENGLGYVMVFDENTNTTIAVYYSSERAKLFSTVNSLIGSVALTTVAMVTVVVNTAILFYKLQKSSRVRSKMSASSTITSSTTVSKLAEDSTSDVSYVDSSSSSGSSGTELTKSKGSKGITPKKISSKEREVMKMISAVTCVYIVTKTFGNHVPTLALMSVPGATKSGVNVLLYQLIYAYKGLFDVINSSVNMFFYLRTSSKYRATFNSIFSSGNPN